MTRSERTLLVKTGALGLVLTVLAGLLGWSGLLAAPEQFFYDFRAKRFQYFTPPPTDKLVHLDIDDATLEAVGRWPWPRNILAEIIDEIRLANAKVLAFDVIFPEASQPGYIELPTAPTTQPAQTQPTSPALNPIPTLRIDHDAALAAAFKRFGKVLLPISLNLNIEPPGGPLYDAMVREFHADLEQSQAQLVTRLRDKGHESAGTGDQTVFRNVMFLAQREAMFRRIIAETSRRPATLADLRPKLLPRTGQEIVGSPLLRLLDAQYFRYRSVHSLQRFARPIPADLPPLLTTRDENASLPAFSESAAMSGFVDYVTQADGVVRVVPMWVRHYDTMFPQIGMALACAMLDVKIQDLRISPNHIIIPAPDGDITIPVRTAYTRRGLCGMLFDIPWFGGPHWETMYDHVAGQERRQHVPMVFIWEACQKRKSLAANNANIDDALSYVMYRLDRKKQAQYLANKPDLNDMEARRPTIEWTLKELERSGYLEAMKEPPRDEREERLFDSCKALLHAVEQSRALQADLTKRRAAIRRLLDGRAVLVGYTAVGAIADVVPTSLHARCPGVVVHGAVFNAIMTRDFWWAAPRWVTVLITLALGCLATAMVVWLSPWKALAGSIVLAGGYFIFNGLYLFDKHNLLVGVAGPFTAVATVWAGGTLTHYILERSLRSRMRRRFGRYVDPALIDYAMDHEADLGGQRKELTVVFTDLAGFTKLSEQLGERIVPVLNEYMGLMVPVIRQQRNGGRAYVIKFLGDGIMYFFGAPFENAVHAYDAVASVLDMLPVMDRFNESLKARGLPPLSMRAGIASGPMIVGDAGSPDGSDYTVLGDTVNLGARLEPANKVFGTRILLNERAHSMIGDRILCRPIGRIQVVGKQEGIKVFEALCLSESAADHHRQLADLTTAVVEPFMAGALEKCLEGIERMEQVFGMGPLTNLYREQCEIWLRRPSDTAFDGNIILTAK